MDKVSRIVAGLAQGGQRLPKQRPDGQILLELSRTWSLFVQTWLAPAKIGAPDVPAVLWLDRKQLGERSRCLDRDGANGVWRHRTQYIDFRASAGPLWPETRNVGVAGADICRVSADTLVLGPRGPNLGRFGPNAAQRVGLVSTETWPEANWTEVGSVSATSRSESVNFARNRARV